MSYRKQLTEALSTAAFLSILLILVLFVLFVYPAPGGILFSGLRIIVVFLIGFLFYQSLQPIRKSSSMEHHNLEMTPKTTTPSDMVGSLKKEEEDLLDDLLEGTIKYLQNVFPLFKSGIYLANLAGTELVLRRESGEESMFREALDPDDENVKQIISTMGAGLFLPGEDDDLFEMLVNTKKTDRFQGAVLAAPIRFDRKIKGLLTVFVNRFDELGDRDKILLENYADQIGNHLRLLTAQAQLHSIKLFEKNFRHMVGELDLTRSKEEMLSSLVRFCEVEFSFDKLSIVLIDRLSPGKAVIVGSSGFTMDYGVGDEFEYAGSHLEEVLKSMKPLIFGSRDETSSVGRYSAGDIQEYNFQSYLAVPISNKHGIQGALILESFTSSHYDDSIRELLEIVAYDLGILIDWWHVFSNIRETASRDGLTGLYNHRFFVERLTDELQRAKRYDECLVVVILDLDKFKRINDTYGHLYGDYVLKETARLLKESVRAIDIVARYGGEEFAVILINAHKESILSTMKRMVNSIGGYEFFESGISERITISAGAAEFPSNGKEIKELIAAADEVMYEVKRRGGNDVGLAN